MEKNQKQIDENIYDEACKLQAEIKSLSKKLDHCKELIKKQLGDKEVGLIGDTIAVTYNRSERVTVDSNKLQKDYPEIYEDCKKVTEVRTFLFK